MSYFHVPPLQIKAELTRNYLENTCALEVHSDTCPVKLTGIIATIGPATQDPEVIEKMLEKGMTIARLNFVFGSHQYHAECIANIRTAAYNYGKKIGRPYPLAIALDTRGPVIKTGKLEDRKTSVILKKGESVKLTVDRAYEERGNEHVIYVDYPDIAKVVKTGYCVCIDGGLISLVVTKIQGQLITCEIEIGGALGNNKSVNLPAVDIVLPAVSEKDKYDLIFGVEQGVDMIFASFIRDADGPDEIRAVLGERGKNILVISKIENHQGLQELDAIIKNSDGIMVARGDLGIEIAQEKLFIAQKTMIARCNKYGKPVICAAQLLESMMNNNIPTLAERTDIANAVLDGVDCVMLSGETAKGNYPVECVEIMGKICKEAEATVWQKQYYSDLIDETELPADATHTIAMTAVKAATKCLAAAIIVITTSGKSARLVSRYRPKCPIIAVTRNAYVARQILLYRAILPLHYEEEKNSDWSKDVEARIEYGMNFGKSQGIIRSGDPVVIITGWKHDSGFKNTLRIIYASDIVSNVLIT